jgi:enoyl-CoA hydratase/carnithine racemase
MENETQTISASAHTADYREGSAAFFEKRTPRFVGQ